MKIEQEKTYLLKSIPKNLKDYQNKEYFDIYIPQKADHPRLRIRKRGNKYEITKKQPVNEKDASRQYEFTISLTQEEFEELETNLKGKRARKIRYFYEYEGILAEIDVFQDQLEGLIIADFEFNNEVKMAEFTPPAFCLAEITQESLLAGGMLVGKHYIDIEQILDKYEYKPLFLTKK